MPAGRKESLGASRIDELQDIFMIVVIVTAFVVGVIGVNRQLANLRSTFQKMDWMETSVRFSGAGQDRVSVTLECDGQCANWRADGERVVREALVKAASGITASRAASAPQAVQAELKRATNEALKAAGLPVRVRDLEMSGTSTQGGNGYLLWILAALVVALGMGAPWRRTAIR